MIIDPHLSHLPSQNHHLKYQNHHQKPAPDLRLEFRKRGFLQDPRAAKIRPETLTRSAGVGDGKLIWPTNNHHPQSVRLLAIDDQYTEPLNQHWEKGLIVRPPPQDQDVQDKPVWLLDPCHRPHLKSTGVTHEIQG